MDGKVAMITLHGYSPNQESGYIAIWQWDQIRHQDGLSVSVKRLSQILHLGLWLHVSIWPTLLRSPRETLRNF